MSGIDEGPATQGQFEQFLREEGIVDWLTSADPGEPVPETPVQPTETEAPVERPRDGQGRFTKAEAEEAPEQPEATPPENVVEEVAAEDEEQESDEGNYLEIDNELQTILDKYDGDVGKALRALGDSQSMIGRQGNELGQLRAEMAQMRQALEQGFSQPQQPQYVGPYMNQIDENPSGLAMEALERGDGRTLEAAMRAWGEYEPFEAATFLMTLQQQAAQAAQFQQAPAPTPLPQQGPTIEAAMAQVVQRHPDVEKYLPQVEQVAQEFPTLRDSMRSGPPVAQAQAFEELLKIAKARSSVSDTQSAMKRIALKTQEEVRKEKSDAAVVSARNRSAATAKTGTDRFLELFAEATGQGLDGDWIERSNR